MLLVSDMAPQFTLTMTFADGVIKPSIGQDYDPTGIWDTFFGHPVPDSGDPELAKRH